MKDSRMGLGTWGALLTIDGREYRVDVAPAELSARARFDRIFAVDGLPRRFEDDLVRSSQVCDVPHTWRVSECASELDVTEEVLARGRAVLRRDQTELNARIVTYVGFEAPDSSEPLFLAAGAIRNKLSRAFESSEFPVVSRAIVRPKFRGRGLGSFIVEHRMKAVLNSFFGIRPKAIHFGTESEKILHAVKKVEREENIGFVYIGDERYTATDGTHVVHDYLCFLPWFQEHLLEQCDVVSKGCDPGRSAVFRETLSVFMTRGVRHARGADLEECFREIRDQAAAGADARTNQAIAAIEELFAVRREIGAEDPA
jgi:hypothetical protein